MGYLPTVTTVASIMDVPPPYYSTAAALHAENRDLATTIRHLSNETIKVDEEFQSVYVELKREEMFDQSSQTPSNEWVDIRKVRSHSFTMGTRIDNSLSFVPTSCGLPETLLQNRKLTPEA